MPELNKFQSPAFDLLNDSEDKKVVQDFIKKWNSSLLEKEDQ